MVYVTLVLCFIASVLLTPVVKKLAFVIGATDKPNHRKVHQKIMPRLGGLAIYLSFIVGVLVLRPDSSYMIPIIIGSTIIIITGILDDMRELSAKVKFIAQIAAASVVVIYGGIDIDFITLPFGAELDFGPLAIPLSILWIVGITNAINLIDGLDGLAAGVSTIALVTITGMAMVIGNASAPFVIAIGLILIGSTTGFLLYNFYPAKIFMGDTGALFLGFMIAVLSLLGFKNVTVISFIAPVIILGVPISDTFFAIIRRILHKQPLSAPDKSHLHHCLLRLGYSHPKTVLIIYGLSALLGLTAFVFTTVTHTWISGMIVLTLLLIVEVGAEKIGLMGQHHRPVLKTLEAIYARSRG
ncbi:undecaprenyl/decaprenyl-phosphate alpha-N-acetylglucosaminyl 1-phosphate transferase [Bacillus sp. HMF5848]|uniref:glycosyltransferase family 4 protein n=1 Tax=Bacillus sp. HMF5848 TaxID=2495421 RepID=UPI000F78C16F|nr:MraY family glycosyltransferase [Bacillus sp. HMF5848]RSK28635.1 undecaprenyl/decaprenyl-phosphate alpha-N-acetylglucosaminyl 1-phosphate transferase [Bacillus sp. HMF5848]